MTDTNEPKKPDLIIDDDWKAQAQAEKKRLAEERKQKEQTPQPGPAGETPGAEGGPQELPEASFPVLVNLLGMQAIMTLSGVEDPETKRRMVDLGLAKHYIDLLGVLHEKTQNNLTDEEKGFMERTLFELQNAFVQVVQNAQAAAEGQAPQTPPGS